MPLAPELVTPELEAPADGSYQELLEGHDWETHLPPSPEGRLVRTADYCPGCGASVHFLLRREEETILAARFTVPATIPGTIPSQQPARLFILEHDRMEPKTPEACRQALRKLNPGPGPAWSVPVDQDGQPRWEEKHQPLEPELAPAFPDILRRHRWKQERKQRRDGAREGEYLHECTLCRARMHVHLDRRGRITRAPGAAARGKRVPLPRRRERRHPRHRRRVLRTRTSAPHPGITGRPGERGKPDSAAGEDPQAPGQPDEENMKNGQNAVMESITRKLEAQSIQVRATGAHGQKAVDITTIDSDPDTQCASP